MEVCPPGRRGCSKTRDSGLPTHGACSSGISALLTDSSKVTALYSGTRKVASGELQKRSKVTFWWHEHSQRSPDPSGVWRGRWVGKRVRCVFARPRPEEPESRTDTNGAAWPLPVPWPLPALRWGLQLPLPRGANLSCICVPDADRGELF